MLTFILEVGFFIKISMELSRKDLPADLIDSLNIFKEFFGNQKIQYWLGGGLLQKIYEQNFEEIKSSWENNNRIIMTK